MKYALSILLTVFLSQPIFAAEEAEPAPGWSSQITHMTWQGTGVKRDMRGKQMPIESIYSGNTETEGNVAFTCYIKSFSASFAPDAVDLESVLRQGASTKQVKLRRPDIKINGEKIDRTDWIYLPKLGVYRARKKSTSAKLYNAVIRRDKIEVKTRRRDYVALNLPPVDITFKNFGPECGLGAHAKKAK